MSHIDGAPMCGGWYELHIQWKMAWS